MPRARKCQRRGIQRGVQRLKAGIRVSKGVDNQDISQEEPPEQCKTLLDKYGKQIGNICFYTNATLCFTFCAVRHEEDSEGNLRLCRWWKAVLFYIVYTIASLSVAHRAYICIQVFTTGAGFDLGALFCAYGLVSSLTGLIVGRGVVIQPETTIELIKSWNGLLDILEEMSRGGRLSLLNTKLRSFQIFVVSSGQAIATFAFPTFSLIFTSTPIFIMPMLESLRCFQDEGKLPIWCWRAIFYFLELLLAGWPFLALGMTAHVVVIEASIMTTFMNELRKLPTNSLGRREYVERVYIMLQLHNKLFGDWFKPIVVPILFSSGGSIVICLYFPIRYYELSGIMSLAFLAIGGLILVTIEWLFMDAFTIMQASEAMLGKIQTLPDDLNPIPRTERTALLKRSKILRPMVYPLASFGMFSVEVPVIYTDEIINQLLFLLSY